MWMMIEWNQGRKAATEPEGEKQFLSPICCGLKVNRT